jgi:hypothetical protein
MNTDILEGVASLYIGERYNDLSIRDKKVVNALIEADFLQKRLDAIVNGINIYVLE